MALLTAAEVAEACGFFQANGKPDLAKISVYKGRGKLVCVDRHYDDRNETNAAFIALHAGKAAAAIVPPAIKEQVTTTHAQRFAENMQDTGEIDAETIPESDKELTHTNQTVLNKQKTYADIQQIKARTEILRLQKEKVTGQLIPTELVKILMVQLSKSINTEFHQAIDAIITDLAAKLGLSNTQQAELRKSLTETVNRSIHKSVDTAKAGLANLVMQITEKKKAAKK